jgi:siroheme synthase
VFGRGGEELQALRDAGIDVTVIPGVSAATAAPALAGIPLTHRGVASSVAFVTARTSGGASVDGLERVADAVDTLVVLMPVGRLEELSQRLRPVVGADMPAALVIAASTADERVVAARIGDLPGCAVGANHRLPATLVVGDVVALSRWWPDEVAEPPGQLVSAG